jgi:hypothetical protein
LAIDPRANFSGGPHETVTALAAASCANFPRTALRGSGGAARRMTLWQRESAFARWSGSRCLRKWQRRFCV